MANPYGYDSCDEDEWWDDNDEDDWWHEDYLFCNECGVDIEFCTCGDSWDYPDDLPDFGGVTC